MDRTRRGRGADRSRRPCGCFAEHVDAEDNWNQFPPSARRGILEWIVTAKRPETRAARVHETARLASIGERAARWQPKRDGR
ncbi:YdeI/OmpD-associated family protein [Rhodococcus sp. 06-1474-1B]|uniref:YdeI/OmpD-associated family protein n=1 Tax=Rhodococcus sp. 06-1474-1B TaxID=2022499 RepID=UPI001C3DC37A